jgi:hypothetical protein
VSKNTYSKYGSALPQQHHIMDEYEEKFTTGQGGQAVGQLITFKIIQGYKTSYRASELGRFCAVMYKTVTPLLQDRQQNTPLVNALINFTSTMSCLQYSHNLNPYHFFWVITAKESLYIKFTYGWRGNDGDHSCSGVAYGDFSYHIYITYILTAHISLLPNF